MISKTPGTVYWITGLAGAGKSTLGKMLSHHFREKHRPVYLLDGDELRKIFDDDLGYSKEDRLKCAWRYARLCKSISEQGIDVVCSTISMFENVRKWNRGSIANYVEIYLKVSDDVLASRNQRDVHKKLAEQHLVRFDGGYDEPTSANIVLANDGRFSPQDLLNEVITKLQM